MPMRTLSRTVWSNAGVCDCGIYASFFASSRREYAVQLLPVYQNLSADGL